jgi:phage shock protein A
MQSLKTIFICVILIIIAFGIGYGLGYWKLQMAEKEWTAAKGEMQTKISTLEKEMALVKARESLRELGDSLTQVSTDISEKNFGLAIKTLEGMKQTFLSVQTTLGGEMKTQFDFFLPALEEIKKEAESLDPNAGKRVEEVKKSFEQALRPAKKG